MIVFFYIIITALALAPAIIIPKGEWDVKLWLYLEAGWLLLWRFHWRS